VNAGKWLILSIFGVALAAGVGSWMHRYYRTDEVQRFWGAQTLGMIANSPEVDLIVRQGDQEIKRADLSQAKGMLNIRYMLTSDFTYDDLEGGGVKVMVPTPWALEFRRGPEVLRLGFHHDCTLVFDETGSKSAALVPAAAEHLRIFLDEQVPEEAKRVDAVWLPKKQEQEK
jgi:hypothetical protein